MKYIVLHKLVLANAVRDITYGEALSSTEPTPRYQIWTNKPLDYVTLNGIRSIGAKMIVKGEIEVDGETLKIFELPSPVMIGNNAIRLWLVNNTGAEEITFNYQRSSIEPVTRFVPSKPRTNVGSPNGHQVAFNLDGAKGGKLLENVEITPGGVTTAERDIPSLGIVKGTQYGPMAGYGLQVSTDGARVRNFAARSRLSEYALYARFVRDLRVENFTADKGSAFEALLRLSGAQGTFINTKLATTGPGIDGKKTITLARGFTTNAFHRQTPVNGVVFDQLPFDSVLATDGVTFDTFEFLNGISGLNAMSRGNSGPLVGAAELFRNRGQANVAGTERSEGGQMLTTADSVTAVAQAVAFVAARAAGFSRREIIRAAFVASRIQYLESDLDDTLWNRDHKFGQRSIVKFIHGTMYRDPGTPTSPQYCYEIQPGARVLFEDVDLSLVKVEPVTPEVGGFLSYLGFKNTDWSLPGDMIKPSPAAKCVNCTYRGKRLDFDWLSGAELAKAFS